MPRKPDKKINVQVEINLTKFEKQFSNAFSTVLDDLFADYGTEWDALYSVVEDLIKEVGKTKEVKQLFAKTLANRVAEDITERL